MHVESIIANGGFATVCQEKGVDVALDSLAGMIVDGLVDEGYVMLRGIIGYVFDPMFVGAEDDCRIVKKCPVDDLPATLARWETLGRCITSAHFSI